MTGDTYLLQEYSAIKARIDTELSRHRDWQDMPKLLDALDALRSRHPRRTKRSPGAPVPGEARAAAREGAFAGDGAGARSALRFPPL